jgi:hypothetical protein
MNSKKLLQLLKKNLIPDLHVYEERFYPIDGYSEEFKLPVEVKVKHTFYHWVIIEEHKYRNLMKYKKSLYVNSMKKDDGTYVTYAFYLHQLPELNFKQVLQPSASNELYNGWKEKSIAEIHINNAIEITNRLVE